MAPNVGRNQLFIEEAENEELLPQVVLLDTDPDITLGQEEPPTNVQEVHIADAILHAEPGVEPYGDSSQDESEASQHELNAPESIPQENSNLEVQVPDESPKDETLTSQQEYDETSQEDVHIRGVCTPCEEDTEESYVAAEVTPIQESANETSIEDSTIIHQESGETGTHPEESQMKMAGESTSSVNSSTLAEKADKGCEHGADFIPIQESTQRDEPVGREPRASQESGNTEKRHGVQMQICQVLDAKPKGRAHNQTTSKEKEGEQVHTESTTGSVQRVEHLTPVKKCHQKPKEKDESPQTKEPKTEAVQESNEAVQHVQGQAVQESEGLSPAEGGNSDTNTYWQSTDL